MKIQIIWPNFDCPIGLSIGVAQLSGALKAAGHDTRILHISEMLDYAFDAERILSDVRDYGPDLVAISSAFTHFPEMSKTARLIKDRLGLPILIGGVHATLNAAEVMEGHPWIDFANVGEGDDSIVELAAALETGGDATRIANVWARKQSRIVANSSRPLKDITTLPWMDLEGWQFKRLTELRRGWVNVYMNRGCPYRCSYCHNNGMAKVLQKSFKTRTSSNKALGYLRYRGIDDMIAELRSIVERYDFVRFFSFNDDTFTMDQEYTKAFLVRYKKEIGLPWVCNTTVLDVDREMLDVMKDSYCDLVRFGLETATERIKRDVLKRTFSNKKAGDAFAYCRSIGLRSFAYNILANPGETRSEMVATLELNARLRPAGLKISLGYPFPGTEYHDIAAEKGLIDEDRHLHNFIFESKLKWSPGDRLWIDKVRCLYWWWMNAALGNEASAAYAAGVRRIEALPEAEWRRPETQKHWLNLDERLSRRLKRRGIAHYTVPFKDRPEIALLHSPAERPVVGIQGRAPLSIQFNHLKKTVSAVEEH